MISAAKKRPNILLITTDQQRADHVGLGGLTHVETPNMDRIGRMGAHFERAYTVSPICVPTRVSLLTGQYPSSHGAYSIGVTADPFPATLFTKALRDSGYYLSLFGKSHFVARPDEECHISGGYDTDDSFYQNGPTPYLDFHEFEGSTGHTINTVPSMHYKAFLEKAGADYKKWFPQMSPGYDHEVCGPWDIPEKFHDTTWVADLTEGFIERRKDAGEPWFCWASFQDPHEPFVCPEPWYSSVSDENLPILPGYKEGEFDDRIDTYRNGYEKHWEAYDEGNGVPCVGGRVGWDEKKENAMRATLGMLKFLDHRLGTILEKLEKTGQLENTLIIFTSDHGELHGHHGIWGKGALAFEDCQRVPLLIAGPGVKKREESSHSLISLVDLPRTCLDFAGVPIPQGMQGVNQAPMLMGEVEEVRDAVLVECHPTRKSLANHTLITDDWKLVVYRNSEEGELYCLESDPDQSRNLWDKNEYADVKAKLLLRLTRLNIQREGEKAPRNTFG
ncbi:sulfatase family protein [Pelagicoccus mobilis]|uniref:Sulfatase-like hydrolase/transferase n=1 Tax=Pelagicoccus mobilis TaxID=415221 RepID=A0A934S003_9BACT|nr:sulfatase-like hydrolase/transferase [Pelagicoccus mobilis]MBK1879857.1 sulfatase-like hydrolase/transferase [Pelagicoccus mobilis]